MASGVDLQFAPFRSLNEFLLSASRFDAPAFSDMKRWSNRLVNNMLYYQTNYFCLCIAFSLIIGLSRPRDMLIGFMISGIMATVICYTNSRVPYILDVKKKYPLINLVCIVIAIYLTVRNVDSVTFSLFTLAFPISLCFIHASCRLRNLKNKLENKVESMGIKKTPMGHLFDILGIHPEQLRTE